MNVTRSILSDAALLRPRRSEGFTFIEVLIALGIFIVGSVGIVALFAQGVDSQVRRRLDAKAVQVRPEIDTLVQQAVDAAKPGDMPATIKDHALSVRGFTLNVDWRPDPFHGTSLLALPTLFYEGTRTTPPLPPIGVTRSTLDPAALGGGPAGGSN